MRENRTTHAGERTRERILEHALPLFAEFGFAGTSVRKVANAAKVNVATLAYHFEDKAGLYRAVLTRLHEDLAGVKLETIIGNDPDPLRAVVGAMWQFVCERREHIRLLHRHLLDAGAHPDLVVDQYVDVQMGVVAPMLAALRPDWTETQRRLLVLTIAHLIVRFVLEDRDQLSRMLKVEGSPDVVVVDWLVSIARAQLQR